MEEVPFIISRNRRKLCIRWSLLIVICLWQARRIS